MAYNVKRLPTCLCDEAGEQRDPVPECRHVPSGLSIECREVSSPAGKARSAVAAIVQLYGVISAAIYLQPHDRVNDLTFRHGNPYRA